MGALDGFRAPAPSAERAAVLERLAASLAAIGVGRRVIVALDGVDGAGKTVLADELAQLLAPVREVHRAGIDGFHNPRAVRYAGGRTPETFYRNSYDHDALRRELLTPFRSGMPFRAAVFDVERDRPVGRRGCERHPDRQPCCCSTGSSSTAPNSPRTGMPACGSRCPSRCRCLGAMRGLVR